MIFSRFERLVAIRYLRGRRKEGLISVIGAFSLLGIALGVAALIIVMAVMNGFREELLGRILGLQGHIYVYQRSGEQIEHYVDLAERLRQLPHVTGVVPVVEGQALVLAKERATGIAVQGIAPDHFGQRPLLTDQIRDGTVQDFTDDHLAIGYRLAQRLGVRAGDSVTLVAPQGRTSVFGTIPRSRAYPIGVIFEVGMYEYDNALAMLPLEAAQRFFRFPEAVSAIEIFIANPDSQQIEQVRRSVKQTLGSDFYVTDWQRRSSSLVNALAVERNVMFLILTLIILVAAFNVISSLIMLVKEKVSDIAILRTMGATRGMIMRIFFISGASIGAVGTTLGLLLGVLFCEHIESLRQFLQSLSGTELFSPEVYFLSQLPAKMIWHEVAQVVVIALGLSWGATLYPALRAARLDPVDALRYE